MPSLEVAMLKLQHDVPLMTALLCEGSAQCLGDNSATCCTALSTSYGCMKVLYTWLNSGYSGLCQGLLA